MTYCVSMLLDDGLVLLTAGNLAITQWLIGLLETCLAAPVAALTLSIVRQHVRGRAASATRSAGSTNDMLQP